MSSGTGREFHISSCLGVIRGDEKPLNVRDRGPMRCDGREGGVVTLDWEGDFRVDGGVERGDDGTRVRVRLLGVVERIGDERGGVDLRGEKPDWGVVGLGRGGVDGG